MWYNKNMTGIVKYLDGKKTYIQACLVGVTTAVYFLGWIDMETAVVLWGLLGAGSLASLRSAVK